VRLSDDRFVSPAWKQWQSSGMLLDGLTADAEDGCRVGSVVKNAFQVFGKISLEDFFSHVQVQPSNIVAGTMVHSTKDPLSTPVATSRWP